MGPLPYPHRATFLATTLVVPTSLERLTPYLARLVSVLLFDHFVRHPILSLGDDDERLADDAGRLLDAQHPQIDDTVDWLFRQGRRHELLWLQISLDPHRPAPAILYARRPSSPLDEWFATPDLALSVQLGQCLGQWLAARRLPGIAPLPDFTLDDLRSAAGRLANADAVLGQRAGTSSMPPNLLTPPARLGVPYLRVLAELSRDAARTLEPKILELDPTHLVARRNAYVSGLLRGDVDRRAILPLVAEAPMYGKPHLSIWGEPFAGDRPLENMGVRHQGIAASLMPANPYACHNYSVQLSEVGRREESYRWADRATVAAPQFGAAHLDCVRRLRQVGRAGQAFAEAQYRCREILDRAAAGKLPPNDWQAPHHAALLIAFAHLDVGRLAEAIELGDDALARLPPEPAAREAFAWAAKRIAHWKTDAGLFARAYAWEGYHRGDPGRVLAGLGRGRVVDDEDAAMWIESLVAVGREDQAEVAFAQCAGQGLLGDGKARLAGARAQILSGRLEEALDQIQIVQLRRSQSRLEGEINRLLRLCATRPAAEWDRVLERRHARGAHRLGRMAARDLADFVPGLDAAIVARALGDRAALAVRPEWIALLRAAVPATAPVADAICARLAVPAEATLAAADALAQEWWTVLVPATKNRDAHAGGVVLALGLALAHYLAGAAGPPSPITGAYRHIATEAMHLARRARYQIDATPIRALLELVERLAAAPEWLLDTWLLRLERALDLEAEHGAYLADLTSGLPTVQRLLRGDERIGWELRMAHDLAADPSQYEPAAMLFERCARGVEGGTVPRAWSAAAQAGAAAPEAALDVHWVAALANPTGVAAPWLAVGDGLIDSAVEVSARRAGFAALCHGMRSATPGERAAALGALGPRWATAGLTTPLADAEAFAAGTAAAAEGQLELAAQHLAWASACDPGHAHRAHTLALALARSGDGLAALRALAAHERTDAARLVGRALLDAGFAGPAVPILRLAARRFRAAEDWATLARAAILADRDAVAVAAGRRAIDLGATEPWLLVALATGLYRLGEFVEGERVAQQLIADKALPREAKLAGLHAMARALAGQGRHVDAHTYAKAAVDLNPSGPLADELAETLERIVAQEAPAVRPNPEASMERMAFAELEASRMEAIAAAVTSPSWGVTRAALSASEFRAPDESGIPVAPRALDAALEVLVRSAGAQAPDAVLARIAALRIRDHAFIQLDPPPPLGLRFTEAEFDARFLERSRRPQRESALHSAAR